MRLITALPGNAELELELGAWVLAGDLVEAGAAAKADAFIVRKKLVVFGTDESQSLVL